MAVNIDGNGLIALGGTSTTQGRVRLAEDTDNGTNYIELTAPASVGSDQVITFPDATTTVVGTDTTQTLTNKTLGSGLVMGASAVTSATAQASTSGTSIDFTGIPSWVKRITVMFNQVSTSGTAHKYIRLGTSGGIVSSNYGSASSLIYGSNNCEVNGVGTAFMIRSDVAAETLSGNSVINLVDAANHIWSFSSILSNTTATNRVWHSGGYVSLGGVCTQVRVTTANGTDTFDNGSINIFYE